MVIYYADFQPDTANLKPSAIVRLSRIGRLASGNAFPIIVQGSGDGELDETRRSGVWKTVSELGFSFPQERVIVDAPPSKGLSPEDLSAILSGAPQASRTSSRQSSGSTQSQGSSEQQETGTEAEEREQ